jgi:hypothetical protein
LISISDFAGLTQAEQVQKCGDKRLAANLGNAKRVGDFYNFLPPFTSEDFGCPVEKILED